MKKTNRKISQTVYVEGMHCSACQELVRRQIMCLRGVLDVSVNMGKKTATAFFDEGTALPDIGQYQKVLSEYDYTASFTAPAPKAFSPKEWAPAFGIAAAVLAVFFLIQHAGLIDFGTASDTASSSPAFALLMGFAASLSSCLAVTGSLVLAFSVLYAPQNSKASFSQILKPNLLFHAGRLGFFAVGGAILGLIGGTLAISGQVMGIFQIVVAVLMLVLAVSMLGLSLVPAMGSKGVFKILGGLTDKLSTSRHPIAPVILGAVTFLLPCGFTQTMQVYALGAGSAMQGAVVLFLFALGTMPVLLLAGLTASWTSKKSMTSVRRAAGLLIIVFSVYTFFSALNLIGFSENIMPEISTQLSDPQEISPPVKEPVKQITETSADIDSSETVTPTGAQANAVIEMHVKYEGFVPAVLTVKKGQQITWNVYGDEVTGCTSAIIVPKLGIKFKVNKGLNTITFTADETGTLNYSCWMGMVWGKIIVEE